MTTEERNEAIEPELHECQNCGWFAVRRNREGYADWVRGHCRKTGLSTVPPRYTCPSWCPQGQEKGEEV